MKIISSKSIEDISILTTQLFDFIDELPHTSIKDPISKVHHLQFINSIRERCGLPPITLFRRITTPEFICRPKWKDGMFYCPKCNHSIGIIDGLPHIIYCRFCGAKLHR